MALNILSKKDFIDKFRSLAQTNKIFTLSGSVSYGIFHENYAIRILTESYDSGCFRKNVTISLEITKIPESVLFCNDIYSEIYWKKNAFCIHKESFTIGKNHYTTLKCKCCFKEEETREILEIEEEIIRRKLLEEEETQIKKELEIKKVMGL